MLPNIDAAMEEVACKTNPLGVKGIGESGTIGAPPTIINAVIDALRPLGVESIDMPATPLRVWETIQRAEEERRRRGASGLGVGQSALRIVPCSHARVPVSARLQCLYGYQ